MQMPSERCHDRPGPHPARRRDVRSRVQRAALFTSALLGVLVPVVARGQVAVARPGAPGEAERKEREGKARVLCASGKVEDGVVELARLFVDTGDEAYIYNQGRCYEENGVYDKAILRFEEYLRKAQEVADEDRRATERRLEDLRQRLREQQGQPQAQPTMVPTYPGPAQSTADPGQRLPDEGGGWSTWPWQKKAGVIGVGLGGASLVLGVVAHVLREGAARDFIDAGCYANTLDAQPGCRAKFDSVVSKEPLMAVGYIGAAVLGGTGLVLMLTAPEGGRAAAATARRVAWTCAPALGAVGVGCAGSF